MKQTAFQVGLDQQLYRVAFGQFVKGMVYNLLELRMTGLTAMLGFGRLAPMRCWSQALTDHQPMMIYRLPLRKSYRDLNLVSVYALCRIQ